MNEVLRRWDERLDDWAAVGARRRGLWSALLIASALPFLATVLSRALGDTGVYANAARILREGGGLYAAAPFEYPPYALLWFLLPPTEELRSFQVLFNLEMLGLDLVIKALLLIEGRRQASGLRALLPFAVWALCGWLQEYVFLRRFDLAPAAMTVGAALLMLRGRFLPVGVLLALGMGTKVFPVLLLPAAALSAWRQGRLGRLVAGGLLGLAPLAALAFVFPWWSFASFHAARGLQVESLPAALLWLGHHVADWPVTWRCLPTWDELGGPAADALLPWARAAWMGATGGSALLGAAVLLRRPRPDFTDQVEALLLPVLAFAAFNFVLSPQYHIWFMPLAALLMAGRAPAAAVGLLVATALIPLFYPSPGYHQGLSVARTLALVARNLLLVAAWAALARRAIAVVVERPLFGTGRGHDQEQESAQG
ncbi:MAG: hypothetical protein JXB05_33250 [Myxococcaceae bacterium]|nr:hypothetical protein [Myxococcaceae bacterium]